MSVSRLSLALDGGLQLDDAARVAVFHPSAEKDLSALDAANCQIIQPFRPDHDFWAARGFDCVVAESGRYAAALVFLPRAKPLARDLIARAAACADLVIVDGQKTDGIDSIYKACRKEGDVENVLSKAHGKLFWMQGGGFAEWRAAAQLEIGDGFVTRAGVFSADGIDPASKALVAALPQKLGSHVADLGAGWGYLSRHILERDSVAELHLVEADRTALDSARINVTDDRAQFHWADARNWQPPQKLDAVVMNPPFHTSRAADPALGKAFIAAAAGMLKPSGQLWLVANRHLPYETELARLFVHMDEIAGDNRFKVLHAQRPARARR